MKFHFELNYIRLYSTIFYCFFADDETVLTAKDLEWCAENLTVHSSSVEYTEEQQPRESPGQSKVKSKPQKVCPMPFILISFFCFRV